MYCEFVNYVGSKYIVREDVKDEKVRKEHFFKSIMKKIRLKLVLVV